MSNVTSNGPELPPMALVRVEHYEAMQAELAALREELAGATAARDGFSHKVSQLLADNAALRARVAELEAARAAGGGE